MKKILNQLGFEYLPMLSEFVKAQHVYWVNKWSDGKGSKPLGWIEQYTNFILKSLTKGMFVPCDRDGNVLEKPSIRTMNEYHSGGGDVLKDRINDFHEAKERVLFVGYSEDEIECLFSEDFEHEEVYTVDNGFYNEHYYTIEQAINAGVKLKLK